MARASRRRRDGSAGAKTRTRLSLAMVGRWATPAIVLATARRVRIGGRTIWGGVSMRVARGRVRRAARRQRLGQVDAAEGAAGRAAAVGGKRRACSGARPARPAGEIGYLPQRRVVRRRTRACAGIDIVRLGLDGDRWGLPLPLRWGAARARAPRDAAGASPRRSSWSAPAAYAERPIGELLGRRAAAPADRPGARAPPAAAAA